MIRTSIAFALLLAATSVALAQDAPPPPPAPPGATPPPPPPAGTSPATEATAPATTVDRGVYEDANSGRTWMSPTALTSPAGTWSFSDWEVLVVNVGYSPTDNLDLSAGTLIPIVSGQPFVGVLTGKLQVLKAGSLRLAAHAMFGFSTGVTSTDANGNTTSTSGGGAGAVGGVATLCLDAICGSHASAYVGLGFATSGEASVPLIFSGSIAGRLGRHVKLIGEIDSAALLGGQYGGVADGVLLWYGVRFTSHNIGVDLGLLEPIVKTSTTTTDPMTMMMTTTTSWQVGWGKNGPPIGFPFLTFTYRT